MIFQSTTKIKNKNVWGGMLAFFFISALQFWIKHYTNFLNITKFVSQHLIATHGHFHHHQRKFILKEDQAFSLSLELGQR
jgi:hypothetical protein